MTRVLCAAMCGVMACWLVLGNLATTASAQEAKTAPSIVGVWVAKKFEPHQPPFEEVLMTFTKDGKFSLTGDGEEMVSGTYEVDLMAKPHKVVLKIEQNGEEEAVTGIFEIKDKDMKLCAGEPGSEAPTEFKADEDNQITLVTLSRKEK